MILTFAIMVWIPLCQWLFNIPAKMMTVGTALFFAGALVFYIPKMMKGRQKLKRLRQARDGERAVAECLDLLRDDGHRVLHDIVGPNFNVDHVIIGPKGVFTIETKTLNKRVGQDMPLRFDGELVYVGEAVLPDNPVPQALAQAAWLKRTLAESTGKTFDVKPAVVFPGWFVNLSAPLQNAIWVLNPKLLGNRLGELPYVLGDKDISLAVFHLKCYIRASNR